MRNLSRVGNVPCVAGFSGVIDTLGQKEFSNFQFSNGFSLESEA
jgi:hypothetical protein